MKRNRDRRRILAAEAIIVALSGALAGALNNALSSRAIPLVGRWNKPYGVPSPGGPHDPTAGNVEIGSTQARRLLEEGALFLDARPAGSYARGHIAGALSMPEEEAEEKLDELLSTIEPGARIVTYCRSMECDEAHLLARALREAGARHVFVFAGGYGEWAAAGLPLERDNAGGSGEESAGKKARAKGRRRTYPPVGATE